MTMRKILLLLLISISCFSIQAQIKRKPHFISLNGGLSMPVGEYSNFDTAFASSAKAGKYFGLEGALYVSRFVGFGLNVGAYINPVNQNELKDAYAKEFVSSQSITINADEWLNGYAMVGVYLTIPIKKVRLDFKFLGGAVNSDQPLVEVTIDQNGKESVIINKSTEVLAFGINYGAHLRIPIVSKFYLRLNAETFTSLPEFKNQTESMNNNSNNSISTKTVEQTISVLNLGVGLAFSF